MSILDAQQNGNKTRFRTPPWHDSHPAKLDIELRLAPDHLARILDDAVERLDLRLLRATYGGTGSQPHPPERLLRVVLFELRRGHHTPAEWHRNAHECEPIRWLLRGSEVSRSSWYTFRDRVGPLLLDLNQQVLLQALAAGVTTATRGAEDGTLVAANASRHKLVNQATLEKRAGQLATALAADQVEADTSVCAELTAVATPAAGPDALVPDAAFVGLETDVLALDAVRATTELSAVALPAANCPSADCPNAGALVATPVPIPPKWMAPSARGRQQQHQRLEQAQEHMKELQSRNEKKWTSKRRATDAIVLSLGDVEAVVGRDKEKVYRPLYNVQVVDDLDSPLILGYAVFAQQNDAGVLGSMLAQVQQQVGHGLKVMLTDAAYAGGPDLAAAERAGVTVYAPVPGDGVKEPKQIPKREFTWLATEETYVCPQGHRLKFEESWREKRVEGSIQVKRYRCAPEHCQGCPLQARCTKTPSSGRAVTRQEHEELIEALRERMGTAAAKALYRLRGQNVELVNADWKQHRKLRRFSGRGLRRVSCEVGLIVLAHNLRTLVAEEQKARVKQVETVAVNPGPNST
jgi:transposase